VPGYSKLLLDLGYRVVVLMSPAQIKDGLFSRFSHSNLVLAQLTQRQIARFVKTDAIHAAAVVMVSTAGKLPEKDDKRPDLGRVFAGRTPEKLLLVEHDAQAQIDAGSWSDRSITLRGIDYKNERSTVVNPHVFGDVKITTKTKGKTVFLVVGAARAKRRNQNLVYDAAQRLLDAEHTNFEIRLIGKKGGEPVPERLQPHVVELGRVDFEDLYSEVENADFIVTAFQVDNPDHVAYRTVKTTGSFQLCYGFAKPCIVQQDFAPGTALNAENSLFYGADETMFDAMRTAVTMDAARYAQMQNQMQDDAEALYQSSLANLKRLIDG
jgi:hypothetical protein